MKETYKISVIGSGSWGTTLANMFAKNNIDTTLYVRNKNLYEDIIKTRENRLYLKGIKLSTKLKITYDINCAGNDGNIIIFSVPVKYLRNVVKSFKRVSSKKHIFVSSSKGIENATFFRSSEIISEVLKIGYNRIAVISGPNFANEVAKELPTATVVASTNLALAQMLGELFNNRYFRVYSSDDVVGVEIAGALKNVMAIASGISDGLGLGYNAKASLITRGLAEATKMGLYFKARRETFMGLAGVGDLVLTCTGNLSRNRKVGLEVAKHGSLKKFLVSMVMVAEGVNTAKSVFEWSLKSGVDMPISKGIYDILYNNKNPEDVVRQLMERPLRKEF